MADAARICRNEASQVLQASLSTLHRLERAGVLRQAGRDDAGRVTYDPTFRTSLT